MLKLLRSLIVTLFVMFYVAVPASYARLGDEEKQIWEKNSKAITSESEWQDGRSKIIVFMHKGGEYSCLLLDGKVVIETWSFFDDTDVDEDTIKAELYSYADEWYQIKSPIDGTFCGVSADRQFFFIIGELKPMKSKRTLTIFGETWRRYGHKPTEYDT